MPTNQNKITVTITGSELKIGELTLKRYNNQSINKPAGLVVKVYSDGSFYVMGRAKNFANSVRGTHTLKTHYDHITALKAEQATKRVTARRAAKYIGELVAQDPMVFYITGYKYGQMANQVRGYLEECGLEVRESAEITTSSH